MKSKIAKAGEHFVAVCVLSAFAVLLFTLKFAWSLTSMYVGAAATGVLALLAVVGAVVAKLARC